MSLISFNTSHVTIQHITKNAKEKLDSCFNTSHVTIQLELQEIKVVPSMFQYISCYYSTFPSLISCFVK